MTTPKKLKIESFKRIFDILNLEDVKGYVKVIIYGCRDKKAVSIKSSIESILKYNCTGFTGELFHDDKKIYLSIGDLDAKDIDGSSLVSLNASKSMAVLANEIKQHYKEYSVEFEESEYTGLCLFNFIQALYKFNPQFYSKWALPLPELKLIYDQSKHGELVSISLSQCIARFFGDMPANFMNPTIFTEYAKLLFSDFENVELKILDEEECIALGMNLYHSVSQGSAQPGKLLTLKFFNKPNSVEHDVALVGKGVCFDSGGISLKPSAKMKDMKMDMMGGATMLSTFYLAVKHDLPINITCTIPLVENMPGCNATKPGDVFVAMNGKSVEVDNTDAEGRLILADAFCYAQTQYGSKPKYLMDAATLTGAILVALGTLYCGYYCNDSGLTNIINHCSSETKEYLFPMPLSSTYFDLMKSNVADMLNTGGRYGGSCTAAIFLYQFIEENVKFVHFDIAGCGMGAEPKEIYGEDASGRPVNAFYAILKKLLEKI